MIVDQCPVYQQAASQSAKWALAAKSPAKPTFEMTSKSAVESQKENKPSASYDDGYAAGYEAGYVACVKDLKDGMLTLPMGSCWNCGSAQ